MAITETIELLGKGLYSGEIPDTLTLTSLPTVTELEYVGSEEFDKTMVEKILPEAIVENIDCKKLFWIDYLWVCRCLRILNYGPYVTVNAIGCPTCGLVKGEYTCDFRNVDCYPIPDGFTNDVVIRRDEFLDFDGDVHLGLLTMQGYLNAKIDKAFQDTRGETNYALAQLCYTIKSIGTHTNLTPLQIKSIIQQELSSADYQVLMKVSKDLLDFGLRAAGAAACPTCGNTEASFLAPISDLFFRPSLGDLKRWKHDRDSRKDDDISGSTPMDVRDDS